jgi:hypothetical protein
LPVSVPRFMKMGTRAAHRRMRGPERATRSSTRPRAERSRPLRHDPQAVWYATTLAADPVLVPVCGRVDEE